ncbi:CHASE4 domain-containing protein [Sphingomonas sp. YR710]|uniref:CHASE4 domain-containing protein n=1 Tax=Sphingomonas sp. YR710 TaxID=1882773 RepID=UPI00159F9E68|nr:CHASE4 domain-containing protein [Sphingomonas sp. YR710]
MSISGRSYGIVRPGDEMPIRRSDFFWPLAVIAGLTVLVLTLGIHFALGAFDRESEVREQNLARNGFTQRVAEVANMVVPQTDWDDAVRNLDNRYAPDWAETNIGKFLYQTDGFDRSFVLDAANRPIFASFRGAKAPISAYRPIDTLAADLIQMVRLQESQRPPLHKDGARGMMSRPIQASALKVVGRSLTILTVTLVQPDFGTAMPAGPRAPIVVTTMPVDPSFLSRFSSRFLFDDVHVRFLGQLAAEGETSIPATDETGRVVALLAWHPLNPGYGMLRRLWPQILIACLILLAVVFTQLRRIFGFADELIAQSAVRPVAADDYVIVEFPTFRDQLALEIGGLGQGIDSLVVHCIGFALSEDALAAADDPAGESFMGIAEQRLASLCRDDSIIARRSATSIVVLSLGCNRDNAQAIGARLSDAMATPVALQGGTITATCSIGSAVVDDPQADADDIIHRAEIAMESADIAPAAEPQPVSHRAA